MEPGAAELYDQALLGILQHVGNVQDFLRVLFGFLYRKTDFYRLLRHPTDRMGFPPGAAQALVLQVTGRPGDRSGEGRVGARAGAPSPEPRPSLRAGLRSPRRWPGLASWPAAAGKRSRRPVSSCSWRARPALGCPGGARRTWVSEPLSARSAEAPGCLPVGDGSADLRARGHGLEAARGLATRGFCGCGPLVWKAASQV